MAIGPRVKSKEEIDREAAFDKAFEIKIESIRQGRKSRPTSIGRSPSGKTILLGSIPKHDRHELQLPRGDRS